MSKILITVPTWNESLIIASNLRVLYQACTRLFNQHEWMIEVSDNGSTDDTVSHVCRLMAEFPSLTVQERVRRGKGGAIQASWVSRRNAFDVFIFLDADLAADVEQLSALAEPILNGTSDIVCGVRDHAESLVERSWYRRFFSWLYRQWQKQLLSLQVGDVQCGFKAVSSKVVRDVVIGIEEQRWLFDTELLVFSAYHGFRIQQLPVRWVERRACERRSSLHVWRDGWEFVFGALRIHRRVKKLSTVQH